MEFTILWVDDDWASTPQPRYLDECVNSWKVALAAHRVSLKVESWSTGDIADRLSKSRVDLVVMDYILDGSLNSRAENGISVFLRLAASLRKELIPQVVLFSRYSLKELEIASKAFGESLSGVYAKSQMNEMQARIVAIATRREIRLLVMSDLHFGYLPNAAAQQYFAECRLALHYQLRASFDLSPSADPLRLIFRPAAASK